MPIFKMGESTIKYSSHYKQFSQKMAPCVLLCCVLASGRQEPPTCLVINLCVSRINATQGRASLCEPALSNAPVQPRNCSNVTRSFHVREFGGWERDQSLWRKFYPAKMLSYTVIRACMVNYTIDYRDYAYGIADWKRINFARHSPNTCPQYVHMGMRQRAQKCLKIHQKS